MPVFTWMGLVTQFLMAFAMPVITVALFLLLFDRLYDATFFDVADGADPLLWEHLFWIFGHPEVYILILPAFGIISEIIPVFSRKPLFGYPFMVFSGIAIGFMGWGVWAHHVRLWHRPDLGGGLQRLDHVHRRANRREDLQLDGDPLGRQAPVHDGHKDSPSAWWRCSPSTTCRRLPCRLAQRPPADRHLLHRRPLPLRDLRRRTLLGFLGGFYFWWPRCSATGSTRRSARGTSG